MSELSEKLKQKMMEKGKEDAAAKKATTPAVADAADDEAIEGIKQAKSGGQGRLSGTPKPEMTELAAADVIEVAAAQPTEYTVVSGDNLSAIAQNLYGDANRWRDIYEANKKTIGANPSAIRVGMVLVIPQ